MQNVPGRLRKYQQIPTFDDFERTPYFADVGKARRGRRHDPFISPAPGLDAALVVADHVLVALLRGAPRSSRRRAAICSRSRQPLDFIARLAALVPPPRVHLTRFHGVFAANAALRAAVTPAGDWGGRRPAAPAQPPTS